MIDILKAKFNHCFNHPTDALKRLDQYRAKIEK